MNPGGGGGMIWDIDSVSRGQNDTGAKWIQGGGGGKMIQGQMNPEGKMIWGMAK